MDSIAFVWEVMMPNIDELKKMLEKKSQNDKAERLSKLRESLADSHHYPYVGARAHFDEKEVAETIRRAKRNLDK